MTALADEQTHRDPLKQPRYMTFEQFFRELGHTDEEIEEVGALERAVGIAPTFPHW